MFKNIYTTFASNFASALLNLLIAVVISQTLGAHAKGEQSIIITNIVIILLFTNIVGGSTLVYIVPRFDNKKVLIYSYLWALLVCLVAFGGTRFFPQLQNDYLIHTFIITFISALASVNTMILLGKEKIIAKNIIHVLQIFFVAAFLIFSLFVLQNRTIFAYIHALYIGYGIAFVLSSILVWSYRNAGRRIDDAKLPLIPGMFQYGFFNQLGHIMQMLSLRLSYYLLLLYHSNESVGIYSIAVAITESVWLISKSIATVQYARITNSTDELYNMQLTVKLLRSALIFSIIMILVLGLLPPSFYRLLFGDEFAPVRTIILLLVPGIFMYNFFLIPGHYFSGKGKYHINTIACSIGLFVTLIFSLLLIPRYDYFGAAIAATLSFTATSAYVFFIFRKLSGLPFREFVPSSGDLNEFISFVKKTFNKDA
ncbi:MAG: hypothetical protein EA393_06980 [Bacteroidetes bacterium]|nr:MAG: hypothetical protein EA393_06980 [Bacteroidota bacterium]